MMLTDKEKEALRVVGHLLEHHPATHDAALDKIGTPVSPCAKSACRWCIVGAISAVNAKLGTNLAYYKVGEDVFGDWNILNMWEGPHTSNETRLSIAKKLQAVR